MARPEGQLNIDAAEVTGQVAVFVLGVDDVDLGATPQRTHDKGRQQIGLAGAGVAKDADVGVCIAPMVEGIHEHRRAAGAVLADDQPAYLLDLGSRPRKKCDERARVEDTLAREPVDTDGESCQVTIEHPERAWLQLAKSRARGGSNLFGSFLERRRRRGHKRDVDRDMERLLLARGEAPLQILGVRQSSREERIASARVELLQTRSPHVGQLALEVVDHPRHRQGVCVPGEAGPEAGWDEAKQPAGLELHPRHALDVPGSAPAVRNGEIVGELLAENRLPRRR